MLITIEKLKRKLNVKESWVRGQIHAKKIPYLKVGHHIRFEEAMIDQWVSKNREKNGSR